MQEAALDMYMASKTETKEALFLENTKNRRIVRGKSWNTEDQCVQVKIRGNGGCMLGIRGGQ